MLIFNAVGLQIRPSGATGSLSIIIAVSRTSSYSCLWLHNYEKNLSCAIIDAKTWHYREQFVTLSFARTYSRSKIKDLEHLDKGRL